MPREVRRGAQLLEDAVAAAELELAAVSSSPSRVTHVASSARTRAARYGGSICARPPGAAQQLERGLGVAPASSTAPRA